MAITHIGTTVPAGNPTTGGTLTIHANTLAGDWCYLVVTNRDGTANPTVTDNDTGGNAWARIDAGATGQSVWAKKATAASASKTVTVGSAVGSCAFVCSVFRGVSALAVPHLGIASESNASGDVSLAAVTPTRDGAWIVVVVSNRTNDITATACVATAPATIAQLGEKLSTGGNDCSATLFAAEQATAGSTGTISWTQAAGANIGCRFWLLPAASIVAAQGAYALSGQPASFPRNRVVAAAQGAYALAGQAATLVYVPAGAYVLTAAQGSYALSGQAASLLRARRIDAAHGAYALSGQALNLLLGRRLVVVHGTYALSGQASNLVYTPVGAFILSAGQGAYALTGQAATLRCTRIMLAAQGAYALSGQIAGLRIGRVMTADVGGYGLSGMDTALRYGRKLFAITGAYALTGQSVVFSKGRTIIAAQGTYALTGFDAELRATRILLAEGGEYSLTGRSVSLVLFSLTAAPRRGFSRAFARSSGVAGPINAGGGRKFPNIRGGSSGIRRS